MLKGKNAVIFAATGAIGIQVAREFSSQGANVYVSGRNREALIKLAEGISKNSGIMKYAVVDATDENQIESYFSNLISDIEKVDILFNAIGIRPSRAGYGSPCVNLSYEHFLSPIVTHVGSQFLTSRAALKYMSKNQSGVILI